MYLLRMQSKYLFGSTENVAAHFSVKVSIYLLASSHVRLKSLNAKTKQRHHLLVDSKCQHPIKFKQEMSSSPACPSVASVPSNRKRKNNRGPRRANDRASRGEREEETRGGRTFCGASALLIRRLHRSRSDEIP